MSVVVVEFFSTRTLNGTVLRDHFLFHFVLLNCNHNNVHKKILFFCSLLFFSPKIPSFFQSVEYRVVKRSRPMKKESIIIIRVQQSRAL